MASAIYELCAAIDHRFTGSYFGANKELFWPHNYLEGHFPILIPDSRQQDKFFVVIEVSRRKIILSEFPENSE